MDNNTDTQNNDANGDNQAELPPSVEEGGTPIAGTTLSKEQLNAIRGGCVKALKTVHDPEIPVDIYELGLIYKIDVDDERNVTIDMTLTAPNCPVAGEMPRWVHDAVDSVPLVEKVRVNLVFEPPWEQSMMSDEARLELNMF